MKVSKYIEKFLVDSSINQAFVVTGGGAMHLDDAICHSDKINVIYNHNEQALSMCAEGYARVTYKPALALVTSGPGGTNAITGVMGAYVDSIPMLVISGQVKRETIKNTYKNLKLRQLGDQEIDIIKLVSDITKYSVMVDDPLMIAYHLEKAYYMCVNGRKGPVWLDIPLDVQSADIDVEKLKHFNIDLEDNIIKNESKITNEQISDDLIKNILSKIHNARAPLILVGTSVRLSGASEKFLKLVEKLGIPVVTAWNANDSIGYDNPYYVGMPGTVGTRSGNFCVQNADLLLSLGSRLNIRMIGYNHFEFAKNAYKIIVDIDENELKKPTIKIDMPVHCDVNQFIDSMLNIPYTKNIEHKNWLNWCKNLKNSYNVVLPSYHSDDKNINPYVFIDKLFNHLDDNDVISAGNGSACVITFQSAKIKYGQRLFTNSGAAAMGYGFPASIGASVALNGQRVICIDGDGSFMMNIQELATVAYNKLNIKIFIINNNGYLSIKQTQRNMFKPPLVGVDSNSGISFPDFEIISKAFGIKYYKIQYEKDADSKLCEVLSNVNSSIIEVVVDESQDFAPKSSSKILEDGRIVSAPLEDMAPFLDKEELSKIHY